MADIEGSCGVFMIPLTGVSLPSSLRIGILVVVASKWLEQYHHFE
jgi:hypothetical protein